MITWMRNHSRWLSLTCVGCLALLMYCPSAAAYVWPHDPIVGGDLGLCSPAYQVNSTFLEWRTGPPPHFHTGIDIQKLYSDMPCYAVTKGKIFHKNQPTVEIRYQASSNDFHTFRYLHVHNLGNYAPGDSLVDDFSHNEGWCNPGPPIKCYFPRHVPLATTDPGYPLGEHLHFEQVNTDNFFSPDVDIVKQNPLYSLGVAKLCSPPNDNVLPIIPNFIGLYREYSGTQILLGGTGTLADPFIVDADFDILVRANDRTSAPALLAGIYKLGYKIETTGGTTVKTYQAFEFDESENFYTEPATRSDLTTNIQYIYHTGLSSSGNFYYWATNKYVNHVLAFTCPPSDPYCDGAQNGDFYFGTVRVGTDLFPNQTYKFTVEIWDGAGNYRPHSFYVNYRTHGEK